jgi:hypothetical protein
MKGRQYFSLTIKSKFCGGIKCDFIARNLRIEILLSIFSMTSPASRTVVFPASPSDTTTPTRFLSGYHRNDIMGVMHLVTSTAGLGDDTLELINLGLSTAEGTESLLGQLAGALVLAVAEEFDNATLVWGKAIQHVSSCTITTEPSDKTYPETSLTISRTKAVRLLR